MRTENELALFVGGELDAETRAAVRAHLADCAECRVRERAARRAHTALVDGLGHGTAGRPTPALWAGVRAGLERDGLLRPAAETAAPRAPAPVTPWLRRAATWRIAAAVALTLGAAWFARDRFTTPEGGALPGNVAYEPPAPTPVEVQPVALPASGLRRLAPSERSLAESAEPLPSEERSMLLIPAPRAGEVRGDTRTVSPASLRRVGSWP